MGGYSMGLYRGCTGVELGFIGGCMRRLYRDYTTRIIQELGP